MSKQNIKDYNHRFDLNSEVKPVEGEKNKFEFIITPNEKRYDFRVFNGIEGYFDKYDNIFIPKDVLINSLNQILGLPINMPPPRIDDFEKYCDERYEKLGRYYSDDFKNKTLKSAENLVFLSIDIINSTMRSKNLDIETNTITNLLFLTEIERIIERYG